MNLPRRTLLTLALTAAAVAAAVVAAVVAPAVAASDGSQVDDCDGVLVVVDGRALDGDRTVRCAPGEPDTGLAALTGAGHTYAFVPSIPGLICTIDGRPDPCTSLTEDAYWGYWHAPGPDGPWTYSVHGAGFRTPPPGSVEGWRFGDGSEPPDLPTHLVLTAADAPLGAEADGGQRAAGDDASDGADGAGGEADEGDDGPRIPASAGVLLGIGLTVGVLALALLHRRREHGGSR